MKYFKAVCLFITFCFCQQLCLALGPKKSFIESDYQNRLVAQQVENIFENYFILMGHLKKQTPHERNLPSLMRKFFESLHSIYWYCQQKKDNRKCYNKVQNFGETVFELDIAVMYFLFQSSQDEEFSPNLIFYRYYPFLSLNLMYLHQKILNFLYLRTSPAVAEEALVLYYDGFKIKGLIRDFFKGLIRSEHALFLDLFWDFFVNQLLSYTSPVFDKTSFISGLEKTNLTLNNLSYSCDKNKESLPKQALPVCKTIHRQWNSILKIIL